MSSRRHKAIMAVADETSKATQLTLRNLSIEPAEYATFFDGISRLIEQGKSAVVRHVNSILVATYWLMGQRIVNYEQSGLSRAAYGDYLILRLSGDLTKKFGKGWGEAQLRSVRQFYLNYKDIEKRYTPCSESLTAGKMLESVTNILNLSWSHYRELMRIEESDKRNFYETLCVRGHWSARQLTREIKAMLFERSSLSRRKDIVLKHANDNPIVVRPEDEIKDSYILDFLDLKDEYSETDLEDALIRHMERFLMELGCGFAFVARQKRFSLDGDDYRMDLVLYHIPSARYVILEIKTTRFTHACAGQMNFYLNWAKDHFQPKAENEPFGIILCADARKTYAQYAIAGMKNKIFVAKYKLQLPDPGDLQKELARGRDLFLHRQACHTPAKTGDGLNG